LKAITAQFPRSHGYALLALALALRLGHALHGGGDSGLYLDAEVMARTAQGLGSALPSGGQPYLLSPLYPWLMAPFLGLDHLLGASSPLLGLRLLQALMGAITALLVARLAAGLAGRRAGWIAGLLAALHGPSIYYEGEILVAGPQALLLVSAFYLAHGAHASARPNRRWFGSGLALGLASALRPTALPLALVLLVQGWREAGAGSVKRILAGLAIAILPFTASNLFTSGEPVLLTASGGFNFWVGNHAGASGLFEAPPGYDLASDPVALQLARAASGEDLDFGAASAWWRDRALGDMARAPLEACARLGRKVLFFLHPVEIPQLGPGYGLARDTSPWIRWPLDSRWLLLLALCAPLVLRRSLPLWAGLSTYGLVLVAFFVVGRYRAPILPVAAALAGITLDGIWSLLAAGRVRGRIIVGGLILLGGASLLVHGKWLQVNARGGADLQARRAGLELLEAGRGHEAVQLLSEALAQQDNLSTRTALGMALAATGRATDAAREFRRVLGQDSARPDAAFHLAGLLVGPLAGDNDAQRLGTTRAAEVLYRSALNVRPGWAEAHFNLGATLLNQHRFEEVLDTVGHALELAAPKAPWRPEALRVLEIARSRLPSAEKH
jgi:Tfp pilus assembly protein PilF/4-amino-4-deoxy-L-arabinose transferase-like glycosyltransferase